MEPDKLGAEWCSLIDDAVVRYGIDQVAVWVADDMDPKLSACVPQCLPQSCALGRVVVLRKSGDEI